MDILAILDDHLGFIERFYSAAAEPFQTILRTIEAEEEPFIPQYAAGDHDGPEYLAEWMEADKMLGVVGSTSLSLLEKALHDYLREFVEREGGPGPKRPRESWFDHHCRFLEENTPFLWTNAPVSREKLEQINLVRNDFVHHERLGCTSPHQSEMHFRKHPISGFADELDLAAMTGQSYIPELPVLLKVTRDNLREHVDYVRRFCTFVEAQGTTW